MHWKPIANKLIANSCQLNIKHRLPSCARQRRRYTNFQLMCSLVTRDILVAIMPSAFFSAILNTLTEVSNAWCARIVLLWPCKDGEGR